jgi:hypothetical protein
MASLISSRYYTVCRDDSGDDGGTLDREHHVRDEMVPELVMNAPVDEKMVASFRTVEQMNRWPKPPKSDEPMGGRAVTVRSCNPLVGLSCRQQR